jgi:hypothetical protein
MPDTNTIYQLDQPLVAGSYVAITLAWDRSVVNDEAWGNPDVFNAEVFVDKGVLTPGGATIGKDDLKFTIFTDPDSGAVLTEPFVDLNDNDTYDHGLAEDLKAGGLANLDLYLMPTGSTDLDDAIALSNSTLYSEEHIFAQVPVTGPHSIWVRHVGGVAGELGQYYGLAWWTVPAPPALPGDYNEDGVVDAADYVVWRDRWGQTFTLPGEDPAAATPGLVDQEDYDYWRINFGQTGGSGAAGSSIAIAVPEPASAWMLVVAMAVGLRKHRRMRT